MPPLDPASPWPFVGMGGLVSMLFLYGAAGLLTPWWVVVLLVACWVVLFVQACRWWTPYPSRLPWLALAAAALWFAVLIPGGLYLDWTLSA